MAEALLQTDQLSIQFGGHKAVSDVSLRVEDRTFKSIIGPNGAGKTTLFNLISGQLKPTSGRVLFRGNPIQHLSPPKRTKLGIGRSFQITNIFPNLTVLENVRMAVQSKENVYFSMFRHFKSFPELEAKAYEYLVNVHLSDKADQVASALAHGEKRKLEIAILLALDAEVLLLDEPTAGMSLEEVPAIIDVIRSIRDQRDRTIVLIEHKMDLVLDLSDSIAVLFHGELIADDEPEAIMKHDRVQSAYLGGDVVDDDASST
ncbi:ABC transporter ATP-binding protein [Geomicrobium sp. JCM 19039]|uniref:ABC transporter ATP-binding protein n=1 Tax=Geomicrobium sp. JCM 19039 TaxID=1460636 RepID=UPI00045F4805|nr:ABC transporter ATP-binding protein [Geomicrobium sp. JCM 19039]GAK13281.1 branched-chain amino acid transport ATP-binding protein LivG [Geomicrobium sp. JCM 19039]